MVTVHSQSNDALVTKLLLKEHMVTFLKCILDILGRHDKYKYKYSPAPTAWIHITQSKV